MKSTFTPETAERLLTGLRDGLSVEQACEQAGIPRSTFGTWMRKGAREDGGAFRDFRVEVERARLQVHEGGLSEEELVRLLEGQARRGHIRAIHLLLMRPWDRERDRPAELADASDPLGAVVSLAERRRVG